MPSLIISTAVRTKLERKHQVAEPEIKECFYNQLGNCLTDDREEHRTDPETLWFVAETNRGRVLKVVFILKDGNIHIKSAYDANAKDIATYAAINEQ